MANPVQRVQTRMSASPSGIYALNMLYVDATPSGVKGRLDVDGIWDAVFTASGGGSATAALRFVVVV